ncbi:unnamed protein product [Clonostachys rhizophaga]|uniref:Uncharacterized protein n=1 Tax=Clonostachys rhizophaga TaxID=160324 RepID=A0A9N9VS44_9HYPO|nr:unnamed protein product [Clonostachys rhizophaga]
MTLYLNSVKLNLSRQDQLEAHQAQLFWIAYLQESQLLAEFDFPPSGLGKLAGSVALPLVPDAGTDPHHAKYQFFFLALISMRKLLNRVLYHVYKQGIIHKRYDEAPRPASSPNEERFNAVFSANERIIEELDRQLEEWRNCLPAGLNFSSYSPSQEPPPLTEPHEPRSIDDRLRGHLLARYYVAKSILHRPFLYRVLHFEHNASLITDNDRLVGYSTSHYHYFYIQSTLGGGKMSWVLINSGHNSLTCETACLHLSYKSPSAGIKTLIILRCRRIMRVFAKFVNNCHLVQLILVLL